MTQREINYKIAVRIRERQQREQKVVDIFAWACAVLLFIPLVVTIVLYLIYCLIEKEKSIFYDGMPRTGEY